MARAATAPELALYRSPGKWTKLRAAIYQPTTIYTARVNHTFTAWDGILEIPYDTGSGTLADVLADMTVLIGSSAGAHDIGIARVRSIDASKVYIDQRSDIKVLDNHYLTIVDDFGLWARHVVISSGVVYMDGGTAYTNQHVNYDPVPIMGGDRVLKLTGATVSAQFSAAGSYCIDSSISAYAWSAPGSSSSSGMTTSTPTISWNTTGWKKVFLTLTAANGKTHFGIRYVYIWNDANPPSRAQIGDCREEAEEGGWSFDITMLDDVELTTVRDHALVILFGEDRYGSTQSDIGPVAGCENIYATGWIDRETINWNPQQGSVRFTVYGAHHWFAQISSYPDGVELVSRPAQAWTEIQGLTVRKGLYHFLRWRTTATRVMDVFLPDDTKYTKEVKSLAQNLWEQIREMAFLQIFARAGVNAQGQLYIEVHPQLVPAADRTWPTVMTITKPDWSGQIEFERVTKEEVTQVNLSGVAVNASGKGTPYFALSTGHTYTHYGKPEIVENLLIASQSEAIQKAGLYFGWRNNAYPDIPVAFDAAIRLIDCFPRQKCAITISPSDTPRGISYSGNLIPKSVAIVQDPETGYVHTEVVFEGETFQALAVKETVPGSGEVSIPPTPGLPPLPPIEVIVPGAILPTQDGGPPKVMMHDTGVGLLYTENFHDSGPDVDWITINAGLDVTQYPKINLIALTPSGGIYVACRGHFGGVVPFIAYAAGPGQTFTIIEDQASIIAKFPGVVGAIRGAVNALGVDPLTGQVTYVIGADDGGFGSAGARLYIGSGTTFAAGVDLTGNVILASQGTLSYGNGAWRLSGTSNNVDPRFIAISSGGSSIIRNVTYASLGNSMQHVPISTTDSVFMWRTPGILRITQNGAVAGDFSTVIGSGVQSLADATFACDPTGTYMIGDWDAVGRRGKSSDGGATWVGLPNLPFVGTPYAVDYAGSNGEDSRWVAARGSTVRYSDDFMDSPVNKEGNLLTVAPLASIDMIKVVEY